MSCSDVNHFQQNEVITGYKSELSSSFVDLNSHYNEFFVIEMPITTFFITKIN